MRLGRVDVPDYIACVIRAAAIFASTDEHVAMAIAMAESNFDTNAVGDAGCSIGLFQLNTCGGQGSDYASNPDALKDPKLNSNIAIRAIAVAVLSYRDAGLPAGTYVREVARHSGHPGFVPLNDARLARIEECFFLLVINSAGQLAAWPPWDGRICAGPPAPPPPLGSWSEGPAPSSAAEADGYIHKHLERIGELTDRF